MSQPIRRTHRAPRRHLRFSPRTLVGTAFLAVLATTVCLNTRGAAAEPRALATLLPLPSAAKVREPVPFTPASAATCEGCHKADPVFSHPVGMTPSFAVPLGLPLEDGRVTCITCHETGSEPHGAAVKSHGPMLRPLLAAGESCLACHNSPSVNRTSQHALGVRKAHLNWGSKPAAGLSRGSRRMDAESQACLSCHDGILSGDAAPGQSFTVLGMGSASHPVGIDYRQGMTRQTQVGGGFHLASPTSLDPRIRLVDGKVACTTCHSPYSQERHLLVMSNHMSALCMSCHQQ